MSYDSSRSTWLFPLEEFAPASGASPQSILAEIGDRYDFTQKPSITTRDEMNQKGLPFGVGRFAVDGRTIMINDFFIYNDGIAAVSETTDFADAFLEDVFGWVIEKFGFRKVDNRRRLYASTIVAEFEHSPAGLIVGYEKLMGLINASTDTIMRKPASFKFARLGFEMDPKELSDGQAALPKFLIERRGGVEFSKERYFCAATMQTAHLITALTEMEKLAANLSTGS